MICEQIRKLQDLETSLRDEQQLRVSLQGQARELSDSTVTIDSLVIEVRDWEEHGQSRDKALEETKEEVAWYGQEF